MCRAPLSTNLQEVRVTVFRKCLRKYLKGYTVSSVNNTDDTFVEHLEQNVFSFEHHANGDKTHRMSRNFVVFEYGSKRFQVSFKYLNTDLRSRLFGKTKEEQARVITAALN